MVSVEVKSVEELMQEIINIFVHKKQFEKAAAMRLFLQTERVEVQCDNLMKNKDLNKGIDEAVNVIKGKAHKKNRKKNESI